MQKVEDEKNGPDNIMRLFLITTLGSVKIKDPHEEEEACNMIDTSHTDTRCMKLTLQKFRIKKEILTEDRNIFEA